MNEIIKLLKNHRSIRKYKEKEIDESLLNSIIEAGQQAPSSSFVQAYTIIRVKDKKIREEIYKLSGEQPYILSAPEFLMFCPDLNRLKLSCELNGTTMKEGNTESFIIATVDTAIMAQNIMIAAESVGLGGVYIGSVRNNPDKISKLLNLPDNIYPAIGMCLGYPDQNPETKPRLPLKVVLKQDKYNDEKDKEQIKEYDKITSDYYDKRTKGKITDSWSKHMSDKMVKELRPHMKEFLNSKRFLLK